MKDPNIKVEIKHSESKSAWNIIGTVLGGMYKIARVPYSSETGCQITDATLKFESLENAQFIAFCFNHSKEITDHFTMTK